jgi:hypothetical protein
MRTRTKVGIVLVALLIAAWGSWLLTHRPQGIGLMAIPGMSPLWEGPAAGEKVLVRNLAGEISSPALHAWRDRQKANAPAYARQPRPPVEFHLADRAVLQFAPWGPDGFALLYFPEDDRLKLSRFRLREGSMACEHTWTLARNLMTRPGGDILSGPPAVRILASGRGAPRVCGIDPWTGELVVWNLPEASATWRATAYAVPWQVEPMPGGNIDASLASAWVSGDSSRAVAVANPDTTQTEVGALQLASGQWQSLGMSGRGVTHPVVLPGHAERPRVFCVDDVDGYGVYEMSGDKLIRISEQMPWAYGFSVVADPDGRPHVFYMLWGDPDGTPIMHAFEGDAGWVREKVAELDNRLPEGEKTNYRVVADPAISACVDRLDRLNVAYYDRAGQCVMRAVQQDGKWSAEPVAPARRVGASAVCAVDDRILTAYYDMDRGRVFVIAGPPRSGGSRSRSDVLDFLYVTHDTSEAGGGRGTIASSHKRGWFNVAKDAEGRLVRIHWDSERNSVLTYTVESVMSGDGRWTMEVEVSAEVPFILEPEEGVECTIRRLGGTVSDDGIYPPGKYEFEVEGPVGEVIPDSEVRTLRWTEGAWEEASVAAD